MRIKIVLVAAFVAIASVGSPALARKRPPPVVFDAAGWELLGTKSVDRGGKADRDTILVGKYQGRFDQLAIVVKDSELQLKDLTVVFGNGERWSPKVQHYFNEGSRSRAIDLPGTDRVIAKIELVYSNTPGGGKASVEVYGRDTKKPKPAPFDPKGWTLLGSQSVDGKRDRDVIVVGKYQGRFDQLTMLVSDSDLDLTDFVVVFGNNERWSPKLRHTFKEGQRVKAFDLPGDDRVISRIELAYANRPGGGKARVDVYGRDRRNQPPGRWDSKGWTLLGAQTVDGRRDKDAIRVGRYLGAFDQITMVINDSDLELRQLKIFFVKGEAWSPKVAHTFREGTRTRVIDLPGRDRRISRIELAYSNLAGGGKARVEIYGRDTGRPAPPPPPPIIWENKGWTKLGTSVVNGWRDRDRMKVSGGKAFSELMFVVSGSDLELHDITIRFGNNETYSIPGRVVFKEGSRTNPIDLPGTLRNIKWIDFAYGNVPGGGRAVLEVWARQKVVPTPRPRDPTPPPAPRPTPPPRPPTPSTQPAPAQPPVIRDHR
jgi:hypothetical protein